VSHSLPTKQSQNSPEIRLKRGYCFFSYKSIWTKSKRDLNVTEDDLLQAREEAKGLSLEETRQVCAPAVEILVPVKLSNHIFLDDDSSPQGSRN
jgi:hypothetical protein